jgi:hypothetical protein
LIGRQFTRHYPAREHGSVGVSGCVKLCHRENRRADVTLERRIERLENTNRRLMIASCFSVFVTAIGTLLGAANSLVRVDDETNTKRVKIHDTTGKSVVAVIEGDDYGRGTLKFLQDRKTRILMGLYPNLSAGVVIDDPKTDKMQSRHNYEGFYAYGPDGELGGVSASLFMAQSGDKFSPSASLHHEKDGDVSLTTDLGGGPDVAVARKIGGVMFDTLVAKMHVDSKGATDYLRNNQTKLQRVQMTADQKEAAADLLGNASPRFPVGYNGRTRN